MKRKRIRLFELTPEETVAATSYLEAIKFYNELTDIDYEEMNGPECECSIKEMRKRKVYFHIEALTPQMKRRLKSVENIYSEEVAKITFYKALKLHTRKCMHGKKEPFVFCSTEY